MARLTAEPASARADRILEREYEELRQPTINALRARLASRRIRFDEQDLDAFYNQAWHGLHEQLVQGENVENHGGFLVQAAYRRSIDELRREQPDRRAGVDASEVGVDPDLAASLDDRRRITALMEGMRERLDERELQAATLCYLHGLTRPQAAEAMGLSPKRMEKLMDGVSRKLGAVTEEIDSGTWCDTRQSLMKAYAFGVLDPDGERYALAEAHLRECPGCRRYVRNLRGLGAVLPPVALPLAALGLLGLGGAAAGAGAAGASGAGAGAGGAGGAAGAGGGAGAAGAAGGLGGWAAAGLATLAVAAAGAGVYAVTSSGGDDSGKPAAPAATSAPPASAATPPAPAAKPKATTKAKAKARPKTTTQPAPAATAASAPASTPAPAATPAPVATTPPPETTPSPPAEAPGDGEQEFGFER